MDERNDTRWVVSIWISLVGSFAGAEVLGVNGFLHTWIQGRAFSVYIVSFLVILGIALSTCIPLFPNIQKLAKGKILVGGVCLGYLSSILAISLNRPLLGDGFGPSFNAWKYPAWMIVGVGGLSLGWLYGGAVAFLTHSLVNRSYRRIGYLLVACAGIRILPIALNFLVGGMP